MDKMHQIVHDSELAREIAEHNFKLGKKHFSLDVLREKLMDLIGNSGEDDGKKIKIRRVV